MKQDKCFFKIQIPVCRITMQARGFAVWTTPSPRGDWNRKSNFPSSVHILCVWTTPSPRGDWNVIVNGWLNDTQSLVWTTPSPRGDWNQSLKPWQQFHIHSLNHPLTARWLKQDSVMRNKDGRKMSEPPLHREVIETAISDNRSDFSCSCLNHPYTARWLNRKSRYPKRYRDFFYKKT